MFFLIRLHFYPVVYLQERSKVDLSHSVPIFPDLLIFMYFSDYSPEWNWQCVVINLPLFQTIVIRNCKLFSLYIISNFWRRAYPLKVYRCSHFKTAVHKYSRHLEVTLKIIGGIRVTWSKFSSDDPQILGPYKM